jgi:hypothetical protein
MKMIKQWIVFSAALALVACATGCNRSQRDAALASVRELQSSGAAYAASMPGVPDASPAQADPAQGPPGGGPPGAPPPPAGGPVAGGAAPPPPPGGAPAADPNAKQKTPEEIIAEFVKSDPRDILDAKSEDLEKRKTEPWDEERPETFIPETGRKDPMTIVIGSVPKELLPKRSGEDDESELETYLYTELATSILNEVTQRLRCHSVIQIGIQKFAQMSLSGGEGGGGGGSGINGGRGGGGNRFVISEGNGFNNYINGFELSVTVTSISTDEVVVDVSVAAPGTNITVDKQLVFIPNG